MRRKVPFEILSSEVNLKKGVDYETKAMIYSFENEEIKEVYVDLFEDITSFKSNDEYIFIQAKNIKEFGISKLNEASKTLFYNYINIGKDNKETRYILFIKDLKSKTDFEKRGKQLKKNILFNLNELSTTSINKMKKYLSNEYDILENDMVK